MKSLCDLFKVKHTEFFNSSSLFVCLFVCLFCLFFLCFTSFEFKRLMWYVLLRGITFLVNLAINSPLSLLVTIGPVCTVSFAGPYRKGKSYILSEAFDQPEVFPLGHDMEVKTIGIWMWILPEKIKVHNSSSFVQHYLLIGIWLPVTGYRFLNFSYRLPIFKR